jgi:hypothetical protein
MGLAIPLEIDFMLLAGAWKIYSSPACFRSMILALIFLILFKLGLSSLSLKNLLAEIIFSGLTLTYSAR